MPKPKSAGKALTTERAVEALRAAAWVRESEESTCGHPGCTEHRGAGRKMVHCLLGPFGADWPLDDAEELVKTADSIAWEPHLLRHDLAVVARGKTYRFDTTED